VLAEQGDIGRLRDEVDAGTEGAVEALRRLTRVPQ
jgi:hypothetical protein